MKQTMIMAENHLFRRLYRIGKSYVRPTVVIYIKKTKLEHNRLGITATKKIGNAVKRNRARRLIKESYRLLEPKFNDSSFDIVIVARTKAVESKMGQVKDDIEKIFIEAGII